MAVLSVRSTTSAFLFLLAAVVTVRNADGASLFNSCTSDQSCSSTIVNSVCRSMPDACSPLGGKSVCQCAPGYRAADGATKCLKEARLDQQCGDDYACIDPLTTCRSSTCRCLDGYKRSSSDPNRCISSLINSQYGQRCRDSVECEGTQECVNNKCSCLSGYQYSQAMKSCVELRIGDPCNIDLDCMAVLNAVCRPGAPGKPNVCTCDTGYVATSVNFNGRNTKLCLAPSVALKNVGQSCVDDQSLGSICKPDLTCSSCPQANSPNSYCAGSAMAFIIEMATTQAPTDEPTTTRRRRITTTTAPTDQPPSSTEPVTTTRRRTTTKPTTPKTTPRTTPKTTKRTTRSSLPPGTTSNDQSLPEPTTKRRSRYGALMGIVADGGTTESPVTSDSSGFQLPDFAVETTTEMPPPITEPTVEPTTVPFVPSRRVGILSTTKSTTIKATTKTPTTKKSRYGGGSTTGGLGATTPSGKTTSKKSSVDDYNVLPDVTSSYDIQVDTTPEPATVGPTLRVHLGEHCHPPTVVCDTENSECFASSCQCTDGYVQIGNNFCSEIGVAIPLGKPCHEGDSCSTAGASCIGNTCQCPAGFKGGKKNDCVEMTRSGVVNDSCSHSTECYYSLSCIRYRCQCIYGTRTIGNFDCLPRVLGDACPSGYDRDCHFITNAVCHLGNCECREGYTRKSSSECVEALWQEIPSPEREPANHTCDYDTDCSNTALAPRWSACYNNTCQCRTNFKLSNDGSVCEYTGTLSDEGSACSREADCRNGGPLRCVKNICTKVSIMASHQAPQPAPLPVHLVPALLLLIAGLTIR